MTQASTDTALIRLLVRGDAAAAAHLVNCARASDEPLVLVAAALIDPAAGASLSRAASLATSTRDRQVCAIARAYLDHEGDRVAVLAREHLVDYPDSSLVAWMAGSPPHHPPL